MQETTSVIKGNRAESTVIVRILSESSGNPRNMSDDNISASCVVSPLVIAASNARNNCS
jgi:hypothetical protein